MLARIEIILALLVLTCGPILVWRRRDNVLGYIQVGTFVSSMLVPILGTSVLADFDASIVELGAAVLVLGAVAYLVGLAAGAQIGNRSPNKVPLTFGQVSGSSRTSALVLGRTRMLAAAAVILLVGSFALLGYVPFFSADRQSAKYGVGVYQSSFARGSAFYRLALALSGAVFPVVLAVLARRRRTIDVVLASAIGIGLLLSLSRNTAFAGPLLFGIAWAVTHRFRPAIVAAAVSLAFLGGALANELLYPVGGGAQSVATRVAASAPDVHDQLGFLQGFEASGAERNQGRTILAGLSVSKGYWDPGSYAVRTLTGLPDVTGLASGGIRLPAPIWGYASFGLPGAVIWSLLSGLFAGWGTAKIKQLVSVSDRGPGATLNLVLAATFYLGTFGLLANFYFPASVGIVTMVVALVLSLAVRFRFVGAIPVESASTIETSSTGTLEPLAEDLTTAELDLRGYLRVFRRRRAVVAASVVVLLLAGLALFFVKTPVYTAEARVILRGRIAETATPVVIVGRDPARAVQTEIEVFKSQSVRDAVRQEIGSVPEVTVRPVGQTDVLAVSSTDTASSRAARAANAFASAYVNLRQGQADEDFNAAVAEVQPQIAAIQVEIDRIGAQVAATSTENRESVRTALAPQRDAYAARQAQLTQGLIQLRLDTRLQGGGARVLSVADTPEDPSGASLVQHGVLALVLGLGIGLGLALVIDYLDDTIKTTADVERLTGGVPVLAEVPVVSSWKSKRSVHVESIVDPGSVGSEAFRTLRTAVQFLSVSAPIRILQVTSAVPDEGKTTTVANLGVALAMAGQRVIVVSCDLRRPRIHEFFGVSNDVGFTSVLLGSASLPSALARVSGIERLRILPSGPIAPNPSELLGSTRAADIFKELADRCDVVLIDSPPVLAVSDAILLGAQVDACLLTAVPGATVAKEVVRAMALLQRADVRILGIVLSGVTNKNGTQYQGSSYAENPKKSRRRATAMR